MTLARAVAQGIIGTSTALLAASACRAPSGRAAPEECAPISTELPAGSTAERLAGTYRLRLVATSGAKAGTAIEGTLDLQPQSSALRHRVRPGGGLDTTVVSPLFGALDLDLTAVDAVAVGSTTSLDPTQPGVLVIERHRARGGAPAAEITMRLGSDANRRDRQRVDGGYTAFRLRQAGPERLAGTWVSGARMERSRGYFCATRTGRAVGGNEGKEPRH